MFLEKSFCEEGFFSYTLKTRISIAICFRRYGDHFFYYGMLLFF